MTEVTEKYSKRWIALFFLSLSLLIISLDNTVLNVALPSISKDLGASSSQLQWIVDSYVLVFAALLLTMGAISDRVGRKKALQVGLVVFGVCSLWAALSASTGMLISARAFCGLGGAIIMPSTLSLITSMFRDSKERAQAIAIWAGVFGLGAGTGPVLGGWLVEHYHWSAVFYINIPVAAVGLIGGYFFHQESKDEHAPRPDIPGVVLSITGLLALVYGIIQAGEKSWTDHTVLASLVAAVVLLAAFAWWERHTDNAMLPTTLFKNMSFTGANIALTLVMFSMFGIMFFMGQYLQSVQGYSPFQAGLRLLPMAPISLVTAVSSAQVAKRLGTKVTVSLGIMLAAVGLFYLSRITEVDTPYPVLLGGMALVSAGMGTAMSPATNSIMGSVPVKKAGVGSAMNDTTRQVGGALGVAVLGTIANTEYLNATAALKTSIAGIPGSEEIYAGVRSSIQGAHIVAEKMPDPGLAQGILDVANQGFVSGMVDGLLIASIVMALTALVTFVILPRDVRKPEDDEEESGDQPV